MRGVRKSEPLPCESCKGKCCYYAPIELKVWEKVRSMAHPEDVEIIHRWKGTPMEAFIVMKPGTDGECWFLTSEGRCSIYSRRPKSCRALGVRIPCPEVDPVGANLYFQKLKARGHRFTDPKVDGANE